MFLGQACRADAAKKPVYNASSRTVKLTPKRGVSIPINQFFEIDVNESLSDLEGNPLEGGDYVTVVGFGTKLEYMDSSNDTVTLNLAVAGMMDLTLGPDYEALRLRLSGTNSVSKLSGTVGKPKPPTTSKGTTTLPSIIDDGGAQINLPNPPFEPPKKIAAVVVDRLLALGELSAWLHL